MKGLFGVLFVAMLLFTFACSDEESSGNSCDLIGDLSCGENSAGKAVVLECKPLASGGSTMSGTVKEWQILKVCGEICVNGKCAAIDISSPSTYYD